MAKNKEMNYSELNDQQIIEMIESDQINKLEFNDAYHLFKKRSNITNFDKIQPLIYNIMKQ